MEDLASQAAEVDADDDQTENGLRYNVEMYMEICLIKILLNLFQTDSICQAPSAIAVCFPLYLFSTILMPTIII